MKEQASNPGWNAGSVSPAHLEFFSNPRCSPSVSSAAPALDPVAVSKEDSSASKPTAAGEEAIIQIGPSALSDGGVNDVIAN